MDWMLRRFSSPLIIMIMFWVSTLGGTDAERKTCQNCSQYNCTMIFIDGGFKGQIQIFNITNGSQNKTLCMLLFDTTDNKTMTNTTFNEEVVGLLKEDTQNYTILISNGTQTEAPICFGLSNNTCSNETLETCISNWTDNRSSCGSLTCFYLTDQCKNPSITNIFGNLAGNTMVININGTEIQCQKVGDFEKTDLQLTSKELKTSGSFNRQASYSEVLNDLTTTVLGLMGNKSSVSLSLENISGIFVKANNSALKPISLMYAANTNFNIIASGTDEFHRMFYIPREAFEKAEKQRNSTLFAGVLRIPFANNEKNNSLLDNEMFSIDMGANISGLSEPVNLTFNDVNMQTQLIPKCHSWDGNGSTPNWTTDGCNTIKTNSNIICTCTHLTFFALLMSDPTQVEKSDSVITNLTYITAIGCGLSIFFLGLALIIHFLLRRRRTGASVKILINLFLALLLLNFNFLINESVTKANNQIVCKLMAGFMHYSMLSSFQWFFLVALNFWVQFVKNVADIKHYVTMVRICGWVPPAIVVLAISATGKYDSLQITTDAGNNITMCWITDKTIHFAVNIGYYAVVFVFTFLVFVAMLRFLCLLRMKQPDVFKNETKTSGVCTILGLFFLLGLSWGFAFFAYGVMQVPALYIFTTLNSFQGFFLFIYYYRSTTQQEEKAPEISSSMETAATNSYNIPTLS